MKTKFLPLLLLALPFFLASCGQKGPTLEEMTTICQEHIAKLPAIQTRLGEAKSAGDIAPALTELGQWFDTLQTDRATLNGLGGTDQNDALDTKTDDALSTFYSQARDTLGADKGAVASFDGVLKEHGYLASARAAYDAKVAAAAAKKRAAERAAAQRQAAEKQRKALAEAQKKAAAALAESGEIPQVPAGLNDLVSGLLSDLDIQTTPEGGVKINGEDFDPLKALQELQNGGGQPGELPSFLDGIIKPEQVEEMRKQAEEMKPSPEQLKQFEQMQKQLEGLLQAPAPAGQ